MSQKIHIHIEYDYEAEYDVKTLTTKYVVKFYRVFITGLNKGDYGVNIKQRNFHTIYSEDDNKRTHSKLIDKILSVARTAINNVKDKETYPGSKNYTIDATISPDDYKNKIIPLLKQYDCLYPGLYYAVDMSRAQCDPYLGGRRRRPSRKYKKSAKRVFRKKSRSTRRR